MAIAGVVYTAYCYSPPHVASYRSPFLARTSSSFVDVGGFRTHFLDRGTGPVILLIHGGGTWLYSFRSNLEPLASSFRVLALDMPGHGFTEPQDPVATRYDYETTDRVLGEFLDRMDIDRVSLVGHSWGGDWAIHFAQRNPDRVRRLVLLASTGLPGGGERLEWELLKWPVIGELMARTFRSRAVEWGLRAAFADAALVTPEMVAEIYAPASSLENRLAQVAYSRNLDWEDVRRNVSRTQTPTLIIWGSLDRYGSFSEGRALAEAMPSARFELIAGAGHNVHEEMPERINELIAGFVAPSNGQGVADGPATAPSN